MERISERVGEPFRAAKCRSRNRLRELVFSASRADLPPSLGHSYREASLVKVVVVGSPDLDERLGVQKAREPVAVQHSSRNFPLKLSTRRSPPAFRGE